LDIELSAWENMELYAKYYGVPNGLRHQRIKELLDVAGLAGRADFPVGSFSGGMKRRLELVRSLIHRPKILFLDEPTTGLNPQARYAVSHADSICLKSSVWIDQQQIMDNGKLVHQELAGLARKLGKE
jgi:ABC-type multidrug transport system ATPase subunit